MSNRTWIIIDRRSGNALYGVDRKTLMFSSEEIAREVGMQFFKDGSDWIAFNTTDITK